MRCSSHTKHEHGTACSRIYDGRVHDERGTNEGQCGRSNDNAVRNLALLRCINSSAHRSRQDESSFTHIDGDDQPSPLRDSPPTITHCMGSVSVIY